MMVVTELTDYEQGLMALQHAAQQAGPDAENALRDLLEQVCANDAQAAERIGTLQRALEMLQRCEAHMTDLETLITGYRRRALALVAHVRTRQRHDPEVLTDALRALRAQGDWAVQGMTRIEGWALHVLTDGALYPDADPPADWGSLRRATEAMTAGFPAAQPADLWGSMPLYIYNTVTGEFCQIKEHTHG